MGYLELLSLGHLVGDPLPPRLVLVLDEGEGEPHLSRVILTRDLLDAGLLGPDVLSHLSVEDAGDVRHAVPVSVMAGLCISDLLLNAALGVDVVEVE